MQEVESILDNSAEMGNFYLGRRHVASNPEVFAGLGNELHGYIAACKALQGVNISGAALPTPA